MVRHAGREIGAGFPDIEASGTRDSHEKNRGGAVYAYAGDIDLERRSHPGRLGYYRTNGRQRGGGASAIESTPLARRRKIADRTFEGLASISRHGHADDRSR